jgi:hypothetical protein
MILPNKNIILSNSLLGLGLIVLNKLHSKETVSSLWLKIRGEKINSFEKFVLVLDFLYTLKLIEIKTNLITKTND